MPQLDSDTTHQMRVWLGPALVLFIVTVIAYLPALSADFIWDDDSMLTANPLVHSPDGLRAIWFSLKPADYWPLTYSSLWLEWRCWGLHPTGYHATNVLLHALSVVVLWRVLGRLRVPAAWVAAMIFAVHPVNVESVAWITERKNTLSLLFCLLATLCYLRFNSDSRAFGSSTQFGFLKSRSFLFALFCFVFSLLAKTSAVMLPFVLLLCVWWLDGHVQRKDLIRVAPFFAASLVMGLATIWFQTNRAIAGEVVRTDDFVSRLAGAGGAVCFYFYKALLPINLSFVYQRWDISPQNVLAYLPLLALATGFLAFWKFRRTWGRACLFAFGCFLLMVFPVLGFVDIYFFRYSLAADHWQYFAIPAVIALVVAAIAKGQKKAGEFTWAHGIGVVAILALSVLTWRRTCVYANSETLWRDTLAKNPNCWLALNNLGTAFVAKGELAEAKSLYSRSLEIQPRQMEGHNNLGEALALGDENELARQSFLRALEIAPKSAVVYCNLARLSERTGDNAGAIADYRKALELSPDAETFNSLGCRLAAQGDSEDALIQFREALRLNPRSVAAHFNAGNAAVSLRKFPEAADFYSAAVRLQPGHHEGRYNLALLLIQMDKAPEGVLQFDAILHREPDNTIVLGKLALVLSTHSDAKVRDGNRAMRLAGRAVELTRNQDAALLDALAAAHAELGQFPRAIETAQTALQLANTQNRATLAARIRQHLESYQAGRPWRE